MKKYLKFIIFFGATILFLIMVELNKPKEVDWSLSFSKDDKIPYGNFILYRILPDLFPGNEVISAQYPVYNTLKDNNVHYANYIFINDVFFPDELDTKSLLSFVKEGNNVFIAANSVYGPLADTLNFYTNAYYSINDSVSINFINNNLKSPEPYTFKNSSFVYFISEMDSSSTQILGINSDKSANFVRINYGDGKFYFNTTPLAFTNYNVLNKKNSDYLYKTLSYLPEEYKVYWDEYYKVNKSAVRTPLRFILSTESLAWAYYILIFSILSYIIFQGRRKQRIIPILKNPVNTTLEFVGIVGRLYYQQKNHKNIADKKVNYFFDQLRSRYFIKTDNINEESFKKISEKSGIDITEIKNIFTTIKNLSLKIKLKEEELIQINNLIESFYKKAGIHGGSI